MPDFLSHSLFADELLAADFPLRPVCAAHANLFRLGAQGPDLFYYCAVLRPGSRFTQLADALHESGEPAFAPLLRERLRGGDGPALAYLMGWLAHLRLDDAVHPYICETARTLAGALSVPEDCAHVMLESTVEARELLEKSGIAPRQFRYRHDLPRGAQEGLLVARLCADVCRAADLAPPDPARLAAAIGALPALFAVLFDKSGIVKAALDLKYNLTRRDAAARWHIKRPYRAAFAESYMPPDAYKTCQTLAAQARRGWLETAQGLRADAQTPEQ